VAITPTQTHPQQGILGEREGSIQLSSSIECLATKKGEKKYLTCKKRLKEWKNGEKVRIMKRKIERKVKWEKERDKNKKDEWEKVTVDVKQFPK
jgi:hypothetical protein